MARRLAALERSPVRRGALCTQSSASVPAENNLTHEAAASLENHGSEIPTFCVLQVYPHLNVTSVFRQALTDSGSGFAGSPRSSPWSSEAQQMAGGVQKRWQNRSRKQIFEQPLRRTSCPKTVSYQHTCVIFFRGGGEGPPKFKVQLKARCCTGKPRV